MMNTVKGEATRDAILDEAMRQAALLGLEGLSLRPLAESLSLSKSGVFAHFKSKEELQLRVLQEVCDRFRRQVLLPTSKIRDPKEHLQALFVKYLDWVGGTKGSGSCFFISIAQEYDDRPGAIRDLLKKSQQYWRSYLAQVIQAGVDKGQFRAEVDANQAVFDIIGAALAYQQTLKLLDDSKARRYANASLKRLISSLEC